MGHTSAHYMKGKFVNMQHNYVCVNMLTEVSHHMNSMGFSVPLNQMLASIRKLTLSNAVIIPIIGALVVKEIFCFNFLNFGSIE